MTYLKKINPIAIACVQNMGVELRMVAQSRNIEFGYGQSHVPSGLEQPSQSDKALSGIAPRIADKLTVVVDGFTPPYNLAQFGVDVSCIPE